jgi:hypothetical protein
MGIGNDFRDRTPKAHETTAKLDRWDYIKLKHFCTTKEINQQIEEATHKMQENIFQLFI